jgi:hypothetical protein
MASDFTTVIHVTVGEQIVAAVIWRYEFEPLTAYRLIVAGIFIALPVIIVVIKFLLVL